MNRSMVTTSDEVMRRQSAQPCGLRRQPGSSGVAPSRRTAVAGTPSSSRLVSARLALATQPYRDFVRSS